jgi:hypothetical protein
MKTSLQPSFSKIYVRKASLDTNKPLISLGKKVGQSSSLRARNEVNSNMESTIQNNSPPNEVAL